MIIPELVECIEKLVANIPSVMDSLVDSALENDFIREVTINNSKETNIYLI